MSKKYETKIDPITGCEVLTTKGLLDSMADKEGKTGAELMTEMFEDMEQSRQNEEQELSMPGNIKEYVNQFIIDNNDWNNDEPEYCYEYQITEVTKVESCTFDSNYGGSELKVTFIAKCSDNKVRKLLFNDWQDFGSYWDPPCQETVLEEIE